MHERAQVIEAFMPCGEFPEPLPRSKTSGAAKKRIRKANLMKNPFCHWCGKPVRAIVAKSGEPTPHDMATVDHLDSRLSPNRGKAQGHRTVLACFECNQKRNDDEVTAAGIEEAWRRSRCYPLGTACNLV